jgi:hypothetical protein
MEKFSQWSTEPVQLTGTVLHANVWFTPDENGEWDVRVWQLDAGKESVIAEQRAATNKALTLSLPPEAEAPATARLVTAIRIDPAQPVVGTPTAVSIEMADGARMKLSAVPIYLIDQDGMQPLGTVTVGGDRRLATLLWTPQLATEHGFLQALDQSIPIVVLDAAAPSAANRANENSEPAVPRDGVDGSSEEAEGGE